MSRLTELRYLVVGPERFASLQTVVVDNRVCCHVPNGRGTRMDGPLCSLVGVMLVQAMQP